MSTGRRPGRRAGGLLACIVAAIALSASPAAAHDELLGTTPADGSTVAVAPAEVVLTFAAPAIALGTQVVVTGPDGTDLADGAVRLVGATVVQPLTPSRPAGAYRVDWRVVSNDGHTVSGTFTFTASVATPAPTGASTAAAPTTAAAIGPTAAPAPATSSASSPATSPAALPGDSTGAASPRTSSTGAVVAVLAAAVVLLVVARAGRAASLRRKSAHGAGDGPAGGA
jgi:methionine-rich copper-binding protein CopC